MKIINQEKLDEAIVSFENLLQEYGQMEADLILQYVRMRRAQRAADLKVRDTIDGNPLTQFAKKMMGKNKELGD